MDCYLFALLLGFGGLLLMAVLGLGHGHGAVSGHHAPAPGRGVHVLHGHAAPHHGPALPKSKGGSAHKGVRQSRGHTYLLGLLAPQVIFGLLVGFGTVGTLLHPLIRLPLVLLGVALVGAWIFQRGLMAPLWTFLL